MGGINIKLMQGIDDAENQLQKKNRYRHQKEKKQ